MAGRRHSAEPERSAAETSEKRGERAPRRSGVGSLASSALVVTVASALVAACTAIGGVDKLERDDNDASLAGQIGQDGAALGVGDGTGDGAVGTVSHFQDGGAAVLADGDVAASNCTPDPSVCGNQCGDVTDNCGQIRHCSTDCGQNNTCDTTTHKCSCVQLANLCQSRCGTLTDNCAMPADCGSCPSDGGVPLTCTSNSCGCVPDSFSKTCNGKVCGTAVNNCGQTVFCGSTNGVPSSACTTSGQVCQSNGSCCAPDNATPCTNLCAGQSVLNNCGQMITCPTTCPSGDVCKSDGTCCAPNNTAACSGLQCGPATNNCGQALTCPNTCASPYTCGGGGMNANTCGCTVTTECGAQCGTITNNCGNPMACDNCLDICDNGGTCIAATHTCRCNTCTEQARKLGALGPDMAICPQP